MEKKNDTSLISSKSISLLSYSNDFDDDCNDDVEDDFNYSIPKHLKEFCDVNELNEKFDINGLQTPVLNKTFDDKSFSSCVLKNNIVSSTPISSISYNYKTPEGKRKLFGSNTNNSIYLPVSSPSSK
ncbi:uncharacterized protein LOC142325513 isoform X2 [Lycorma delicatula]|uniref:uncharacterized protein LOC142325513 isoform X2 n=1 Tax=Lycorma delicatula TaxID=130591 RepID=UPI003F511B58